MKKLSIVALFALIFCFTASAQGYMGIDFGYGAYTLFNAGDEYVSNNEWEPNHMNVTLNIGQSHGLLRTELALMMITAAEGETTAHARYDGDIDTSIEYSSYNALLNLYLDIPLGEKLTIYPVLGVGVSSAKADFTTGPSNSFVDGVEKSGKSSLTFAWQVGLGARYQFNERHSLDLTVRYLDLGTPEYETHRYGWMDGYSGGGGVIFEGNSYVVVETSAIKLDFGYKYWF